MKITFLRSLVGAAVFASLVSACDVAKREAVPEDPKTYVDTGTQKQNDSEAIPPFSYILSSVSVGTNTFLAGGTTSILFSAKDSKGAAKLLNVSQIGITVVPPIGTLSAIVDNADGTFSWTFTALTGVNAQLVRGIDASVVASVDGAYILYSIPTLKIINTPPVAPGKASTINEGTATLITLPYTDSDSDPSTTCTSSNASGGSAGSCTCTSGVCSLTFTPTAYLHGGNAAIFSYKVKDADFSNLASVTVSINHVNHTPTLSVPANMLYPLDGSSLPAIQGVSTFLRTSVVDTDGDAQTITCTYTTPGMNASDPSYRASATNCSSLPGSVVWNTPTPSPACSNNAGSTVGTSSSCTSYGDLSWTPSATARGTFKFTVSSSDGNGGTPSGSFFVTVREAYTTANLLAGWDAGVSTDMTGTTNYASASRSGSNTNVWLGLVGGFLGSLGGSFSSSWAGVGDPSISPYALSFAGASTDYITFGNPLSSYNSFLVETWISPSAATSASAANSIILHNGANPFGTGFNLRQAPDASGKILLEAGAYSHSNVITADSPLAYWRLGESSGTSAADSGASPATNGTYTGSPSLANPGGIGNDSAYSLFMNNSGYPGYVNVPNASKLNSWGSAITIEAFASAANANFKQKSTLVAKLPSFALAGVSTGVSGKLMQFTVYSGSSPTTLSYAMTGNINTWHHYAGIYDGSQLALFVDGVSVASTAMTGTIDGTTNPLRIGRDTSTVTYWDGNIQDVAIWDSALSPAQIYNHFISKRCVSATAMSNSSWYHLAGLYDGSNLTLFVNGAQECQVALSVSPAGNGFSVGASYSSTYGVTSPWAGQVSDVKIYSTGDASQVSTDYNATAGRFP